MNDEFHDLADRELNDAAQDYERESPGLETTFIAEVERAQPALVRHERSVREYLIIRYSDMETTKVGKRGTVVIPASLRRRYGLSEGTILVAEARAEGVLLRPATVLPVEVYTPKRRAEFLLLNAMDEKDYAVAVREVRDMGLDPGQVTHWRPPASRRSRKTR